MASLTDLEEVGAAEAGDSLNPNPQTVGGLTDSVFTRKYKVKGTVLGDYLFKLIDPSIRITDYKVTNAYLVDQRATRVDEIDYHLTCVFAQLPSAWRSDATSEVVTFPGVARSSLYAPQEFIFRDSPASYTTQVRTEHSYRLGPMSSIATLPRFRPVDFEGNSVAVITDYTTPSADYYIGMVLGRQEIVVESVVHRWRGDIFELRTKWAMAK